ncbi:MAG: hypothetical protein KKG10_14070, partial [Proteobacteria bacterium]|nr:hypothetical protein [Pseudomonadota bacterium]
MQSVINIALVGGETYCKEILEKTSLTNSESDVIERIVAVADPDHESPGMDLARQLGLVTTKDFHDLYNPKYNIDLIIVLTRDQEILDQILRSRPP